MATTVLTGTTFEATIASNDIVLVDFWAEWCGPCRAFRPVYDSVSEQNADIVFGTVDTEAEQALAGAAGITSIPTLMAFRDGVLLFSQAGALPSPALEDLIGQIRALDMDEIHRTIDETVATESEETRA